MARRDPEPRLLTQGQAAAYCGICVDVFKKACPVPPVSLLERIPRYDRHALDRWLDSLSNFLPIDPQDDLAKAWDNAGDGGARKGH
jgi:hypothetical protein